MHSETSANFFSLRQVFGENFGYNEVYKHPIATKTENAIREIASTDPHQYGISGKSIYGLNSPIMQTAMAADAIEDVAMIAANANSKTLLIPSTI